jgi:hypothetical protein
MTDGKTGTDRARNRPRFSQLLSRFKSRHSDPNTPLASLVAEWRLLGTPLGRVSLYPRYPTFPQWPLLSCHTQAIVVFILSDG